MERAYTCPSALLSVELVVYRLKRSMKTAEAHRVDEAKGQITLLSARNACLSSKIARYQKELQGVREALELAQHELETAVQAVVAGGVDPTLWLPDELLIRIVVGVMVGGRCGCVCQRWHRLCDDARVKRSAWEARWARYSDERLAPQRLIGHTSGVLALAGHCNKVYSAGCDSTIRVHISSPDPSVDGTLLQTLKGHTDWVMSLVVGVDGTLYTGSSDSTVRVWSGDDGSPLCTLEGHTECVSAVAIDRDGTLFSASFDKTIRVWSNHSGQHAYLRTLTGHTDTVRSVAVSRDGKLYSGSADTTIRVWSVADGTHLRTLEGHTAWVLIVVVAENGTVYSGSDDTTIRIWSGHDGQYLHSLRGHTKGILSLTLGAADTVFSGSEDETIRVWRGSTGEHLRSSQHADSCTDALLIAHDGRLYTASEDAPEIPVW